MARQQFNAFLPLGTLEQSRSPVLLRHHSEPMVSPKGLISRGGAPAYIFPHLQGSGHMSNSNSYMSALPSPPSNQTSPSDSSRHNPIGHLISPPISRSESSDGRTAELIEDWRVFTTRLRQQFLGEKTHMDADRARAEEVMAEERALWDKERACYECRIADLEAQLAAVTGPLSQRSPLTTTATSSSYFPPVASAQQSINNASASNASTTNTSKGSLPESASPKTVRQESGRNPDGSPFYAPASQHPSRTFESLSTAELRVEDMSAPRETPLRVTPKELTQSDFLHAPSSGTSTPPREGSVAGDSIDISHIEPGLDGVPIRSSAVSLTFAAQVRSPSGTTMSPCQFSPDAVPPRRPTQTYDRHSPTAGPKKTLEIIKQPEGRRRTMHAGHTPNHSVIHFELGDSGLTTPKASARISEPEVVVEQAQTLVEDPELKGPLGLTNDAPGDERFLAALTSRLEEVAGNAGAASETSEESAAEREMSDSQILQTALRAIGRESASARPGDEDAEGTAAMGSTDDIPVLKLKPTANFGRPLGSL